MRTYKRYTEYGCRDQITFKCKKENKYIHYVVSKETFFVHENLSLLFLDQFLRSPFRI